MIATIRPSSDLRNNYNEISSICKNQNEPVFITKNGYGDLAVMSMEHYKQLTGQGELYQLLDEGMEDLKNGRVESFGNVISEIKSSLANV